MAVLDSIFIGLETGSYKDYGTQNRLILIINQRGKDIIHHRLPHLKDPGSQIIHEIDVSDQRLDTALLHDGSVRLAITGNDRWYCENAMIWGTVGGNFVTPVTLDVWAHYMLSTDPKDGLFESPARITRPMPEAYLARATDRVSQFVIAAEVADTQHAGTNDKISVSIGIDGWDQGDLDHANASLPKLNTQRAAQTFSAGFGFGVVGNTLTRDLINSVTLHTDGRDKFTLKSFFLFSVGYRNTTGVPVYPLVSPIVHIPDMSLMALSQDPSEGATRISLPLCDVAALDPNAFNGGTQVVTPV